MKLICGARVLDLSVPRVMGVLNLTPDSFFDGGHHFVDDKLCVDKVLVRAEAMIESGADILDLGGESTRPGAASVSEQEELDRVMPAIDALVARFDIILSVDTSTPLLMTQAAALGVGMINDVRALRRPGALEAAAATGLPVCLMHMQGAPHTMQVQPSYCEPVDEVWAFLSERKNACLMAGVGAVVVDPGIGFGKNDSHNLALIRHLASFTELGPVLLGVSRKSMFGRLLGRSPAERLAGSLAVALLGVQNGARILRVHDVAATRDVVKMQQLIQP